MPAGRNLLAVVDRGAGVVFAELLADRVHLLAQEVFALLLLGAAFDVVPDPLAHHELGQAFLLQPQRQLQPLDDVERFEELDLLRHVEVGRVAGGVRQRAGMGDRAQERADPAVVSAQLEDFLDDRPILALELAGQVRRRHLVGPFVDRTRSTPSRSASAAPGTPRCSPTSDNARCDPTAGPVRDLGDHADTGEGVPGAVPAAPGRRCRRPPAAG